MGCTEFELKMHPDSMRTNRGRWCDGSAPLIPCSTVSIRLSCRSSPPPSFSFFLLLRLLASLLRLSSLHFLLSPLSSPPLSPLSPLLSPLSSLLSPLSSVLSSLSLISSSSTTLLSSPSLEIQIEQFVMHIMKTETLRGRLSPKELQYARDYRKLITKYEPRRFKQSDTHYLGMSKDYAC